MEEEFVDFLGNVLAVGDTVVYASLAGRSAKLTKGVIVAFKGSNVQVKREATSWGGKVGTETRYVDSRTGKGIDPSYAKHQERGYGYEHRITGRFLDGDGFYREKFLNYDEVQDYYRKNGWYGGYNRPQYKHNPAFVEEDWKSVRPIYKDYVTEVEKEPRPVTVGTGSMLKVSE